MKLVGVNQKREPTYGDYLVAYCQSITQSLAEPVSASPLWVAKGDVQNQTGPTVEVVILCFRKDPPVIVPPGSSQN